MFCIILSSCSFTATSELAGNTDSMVLKVPSASFSSAKAELHTPKQRSRIRSDGNSQVFQASHLSPAACSTGFPARGFVLRLATLCHYQTTWAKPCQARWHQPTHHVECSFCHCQQQHTWVWLIIIFPTWVW